MELPGEQEVQQHVAEKFAPAVGHLARVQQLAFRTVSGLPGNITRQRGISMLVIENAAALLAKGLKQSRAVELLASSGLGEDATASLRNLAETWITLMFLMRHRIQIVNRQGHPYGMPPGRMTTRFRSLLYRVKCRIEQLRPVNAWATTSGMKRMGRPHAAEIRRQLVELERLVGPAWFERLRRSNTCAGVPMADLIYSLTRRAPAMRQMLYPLASTIAHANDFHNYIEFEEDGVTVRHVNALPSLSLVEEAIGTAEVMLLGCVEAVDDRFGTGHARAIEKHNRRIRAGLAMRVGRRRARRP